MFTVKGKIIVVTGGKGLLGSEIAKVLRENGATVLCADLISDSDLDVIMDITNEDSVVSGVTEIYEKYGKVDAWINNAYPRTADWGNKLEDIEFESWRKNVDMHLNGYFLCSRQILIRMKEQRFGSLVNLSSIYGMLGPDFSVYDGTHMTMPAAYSAIKGGINTMTKYLAAYYGPYGIRVNCVSPGGIFDNQPDSFVNKYSEKVPLRRMGCPSDISSAIYFLVSDESSYITGHNLMVDGGWSII